MTPIDSVADLKRRLKEAESRAVTANKFILYLLKEQKRAQKKRRRGQRARDNVTKLIDISIAISYLDELGEPLTGKSSREIGKLLDGISDPKLRSTVNTKLLGGISGEYLRQRIDDAIELFIEKLSNHFPKDKQPEAALVMIHGHAIIRRGTLNRIARMERS
jgi:hypothetical protein